MVLKWALGNKESTLITVVSTVVFSECSKAYNLYLLKSNECWLKQGQ